MDALFTVLHANGATSFSEVMGNFPASIPAMLGAYVGLTPEDRRHLVEAMAILFKASTAKRKPAPAQTTVPAQPAAPAPDPDTPDQESADTGATANTDIAADQPASR